MTTVKSINLYTRPASIQKERYDKLQERTAKPKPSVEIINDLKTEEVRIGEQLDLFATKE